MSYLDFGVVRVAQSSGLAIPHRKQVVVPDRMVCRSNGNCRDQCSPCPSTVRNFLFSVTMLHLELSGYLSTTTTEHSIRVVRSVSQLSKYLCCNLQRTSSPKRIDSFWTYRLGSTTSVAPKTDRMFKSGCRIKALAHQLSVFSQNRVKRTAIGCAIGAPVFVA